MPVPLTTQSPRSCWAGGHGGLTASRVLVSCFRDACFVFCCIKYAHTHSHVFPRNLHYTYTMSSCRQTRACNETLETLRMHAGTNTHTLTHTDTHTHANTYMRGAQSLQDHVTFMPLSFHTLMRARSQGRRRAARPGNLENRKEDPCSSS